jgi:ABC-type branched-subunit amino acid transport system substrate-binding protein
MRRGWFRAVAALAVLALVATACRTEVKTSVGVEGKVIKLGEITPLTGEVAVIGKPLTRGHEVYFQYVNEVLGGVGQKLPKEERYKVELITLDSQYRPDVQVQQYNALKDKVLMIAQSLGTAHTKAILGQINEDKILTAAATLASDWPKEKYVVATGAPYPAQFINAAQYLKDKGITPKAGLIYQDDDYGLDGLKGLEFAAKQFGFQIVAKATYKTTDTAFAAQVTAMRTAGADYVFLTTTPSATGRILGAAAALSYTPQWIGNSPSWIGALVGTTAQPSPLVPYLKQYVWVVTDAQCAWGETKEGCEGMKELLENHQKFGKDQAPDYYFIFGYTQARVVHQILEKAVEQGDLTRAGVVKAFESLKNVNMGGLLNPISYGTQCKDKVPATGSTIWKIDPAQPIALARVATLDSPVVKQFQFCG